MAVACGGDGCMRTVDAAVDKNHSGKNQNIIASCRFLGEAYSLITKFSCCNEVNKYPVCFLYT